jgi:hypothetical protein
MRDDAVVLSAGPSKSRLDGRSDFVILTEQQHARHQVGDTVHLDWDPESVVLLRRAAEEPAT